MVQNNVIIKIFAVSGLPLEIEIKVAYSQRIQLTVRVFIYLMPKKLCSENNDTNYIIIRNRLLAY